MDSNKNLEINKNIKTDNFFIVQLSTGKYLWKFIVFKEKKLSFILWNFSVRTLQCSKKKTLFCPWKHEKPHSKLLIIGPDPFLSVLPIGPNPAQISIPVPKKSPTAGLLYNDFVQSRLNFAWKFTYRLILLDVPFVPDIHTGPGPMVVPLCWHKSNLHQLPKNSLPAPCTVIKN